MRRARRSYPRHALPLVTSLGGHPEIPYNPLKSLTRRHQWIIGHLRRGARILLDIEQRRALVYTWARGIEHLAEITVRALSDLIQAGILVATAKEGRIVHYSLVGAPPPPVWPD